MVVVVVLVLVRVGRYLGRSGVCTNVGTSVSSGWQQWQQLGEYCIVESKLTHQRWLFVCSSDSLEYMRSAYS